MFTEEGQSKESSQTSEKGMSVATLRKALEPMEKLHRDQLDKLSALQGQLMVLRRQTETPQDNPLLSTRDFFLLAIVLVFQTILFWAFK